MSDNKLASYIGLAQRANAVLYGEDMIVKCKSSVKFVLASTSAPEKYLQRLARRLEGFEIFTVDGLCAALHRDGVYAVAITNDALASAIKNLLR